METLLRPISFLELELEPTGFIYCACSSPKKYLFIQCRECEYLDNRDPNDYCITEDDVCPNCLDFIGVFVMWMVEPDIFAGNVEPSKFSAAARIHAACVAPEFRETLWHLMSGRYTTWVYQAVRIRG